jgi:hypothetical protein
VALIFSQKTERFARRRSFADSNSAGAPPWPEPLGPFMREARRFRKGAVFADARAVSIPLDRNGQARVLFLADQLERRTKLPGSPRLHRPGCPARPSPALLQPQERLVLPVLCRPPEHTGLCCASVATALARLEASGLVKIVRRLVRKPITRVSPITGFQEVITATLQDTNAYSFGEPRPIPLPVIAARVRPFPARRVVPPAQFSMSFEPSLEKNREEPDPGINKRAGLDWRSAARLLLAKGSAMK